MQWNDDMSVAPAGEEWVMGAIELDSETPGSYVYESVIFDSGFWTSTAGVVVDPVAWCRIEPYRPARREYEWENHPAFAKALSELDSMMPEGVYCVGIAVANTETGEGALILDDFAQDIESAVFDADVKKDILSDAKTLYDDSLSYMSTAFGGAERHGRKNGAGK